MKGVKRLLLVLFLACLVTLMTADESGARSTSLTTTIIITVKAQPKGNLAASDKNAEAVKKMATEQAMNNPQIHESLKEMAYKTTEDVKFSGERIYTITDRL